MLEVGVAAAGTVGHVPKRTFRCGGDEEAPPGTPCTVKVLVLGSTEVATGEPVCEPAGVIVLGTMGWLAVPGTSTLLVVVGDMVRGGSCSDPVPDVGGMVTVPCGSVCVVVGGMEKDPDRA